MEELKILVGMVAGLPNMALWVLCGFLVYKLAVVGSIYGVIRFAIDKAHSAYTWHKDGKVLDLKKIKCIDSTTEEQLVLQLNRIKSTSYLHLSDIDRLAKILNKAEVR